MARRCTSTVGFGGSSGGTVVVVVVDVVVVVVVEVVDVVDVVVLVVEVAEVVVVVVVEPHRRRHRHVVFRQRRPAHHLQPRHRGQPVVDTGLRLPRQPRRLRV